MTYITNLYPDPSCYKQLGSWQASGGVNVEHLPDGRYRYTHTGDDWSLSDWDSWKALMRLGRVVVVVYTATSGLSVAVESGMTLVSGTTPSGAAWTAAKIDSDGSRSIYCRGSGSLTLEAMAVYEGDEWPTVQQLLPRFPWFTGSSMPLN
ncbi:hypothetical protein [Bifidobacterium longum]|uniref:DUF1579 domain-containing protein n=1 Tax=Bifidobacterium longum subsp. infantis TaxID=1682 RepID=A0A8U0L8H7_BIFLI|nr:hypothetical protein [Bifidobacterium longum]MDW3110917.1 hypothetical protein [Bifidobacterium longum]VWQ29154.1 hypothetical protein BIFLH665_02268 [Bifidobacterium longum subsp. infantis]VWQ29851.1 hypothetical protein BIFLH666_00496 [Bifidobacterium longum subsp. infantis]VWQ33793.1 hypothetical protein BIFLH664_00562 [Bifidobacterium longum subsp. infantis]